MRTEDFEFGALSRKSPEEAAETGGHPAAQLKLTVEPVPKTSANKSLNKLLSRWKKIRDREYVRYGYRCGVCGIKPSDEKGSLRLECHEAWEYDEASRVQTLSGLIALCSRCHSVKNWGWARKRPETVGSFAAWKSEERYAAYRERSLENGVVLLEDHFMAVNGCGLGTMREHVVKVAVEWSRRSRHGWWIDFGEYAKLLA